DSRIIGHQILRRSVIPRTDRPRKQNSQRDENMTNLRPIQQTRRVALAFALTGALFLPIFANSASEHRREMRAAFPTVTIENFGQVNDHIFRGGQPSAEGFRQLAGIGVKTVIDLRGDSEKNARAQAEEAGLHYINLPLAPKQIPQAADAEKFL